MLKKEMFEHLSTIRIVNVLLYLIWAFFLYGLVEGMIRLPQRFSAALASKSAWMIASSIVGALTEIALLWILFHIHKIIRSVVRGEAFHPHNPKRLRKVAYGIFFLDAITTAAQLFYGVSFKINLKMLPIVLELALAIAFIGTIVLMVAEVFSNGARLQEEQKFTI
jgi:hypothetical protein